MMIRIFHMGDIHLDSAFHRFPKEQRAKLRAHQRDMFLKMTEHISRVGYDIVLISGDLFDGIDVSPECEECVVSALSALKCPVVISPGNHDPFELVSAYRKQKFGDNVYIFNSSEPQVFSFEDIGVQVCGYAFVRSNTFLQDPLENFTLPEFDGVSILCAHGELNVPNSRFAPLFEAEIASIGFKYAALGHVHTPDIVTCGDTVIAYCGVSEGRGFDELGAGGAIDVRIDGSRLETERVIFSENVYRIESVDVSGVQDTEGARAKLISLAEGIEDAEHTALRILLTGELPIEVELNCADMESILGERFLYAEVKDMTYPRIDTSSLVNDSTLRGEIYGTLRAELSSEDPQIRRTAAAALKCALLAVDGRELI